MNGRMTICRVAMMNVELATVTPGGFRSVAIYGVPGLHRANVAINGDATKLVPRLPGFGATRGPSTSLRYGRDDG